MWILRDTQWQKERESDRKREGPTCIKETGSAWEKAWCYFAVDIGGRQCHKKNGCLLLSVYFCFADSQTIRPLNYISEEITTITFTRCVRKHQTDLRWEHIYIYFHAHWQMNLKSLIWLNVTCWGSFQQRLLTVTLSHSTTCTALSRQGPKSSFRSAHKSLIGAHCHLCKTYAAD